MVPLWAEKPSDHCPFQDDEPDKTVFYFSGSVGGNLLWRHDQNMILNIFFVCLFKWICVSCFIETLLVIHTPLSLPPPIIAWSFQLSAIYLLIRPGESNHWCDLNVDTLWSFLSISLISSLLLAHLTPLPQVFQRLHLSNRDEGAALGELLRWRRAQCEGRGDWKHRPPQSPPLPPTLLWTNRKASPWQMCGAGTCIGYEVPPSLSP